ncbi:MAG: UDP-N-acetylglucosamine 1-carboxyvinyltransferase [Alloprevotella sp.]|nr:UDP-N-acetylglucosamine 1-carboxyvinyltransferase [Alloprevotella sp.]
MASLHIEGGHPLQGEITPQGAKNEALEIIAATLLTKDKVRVKNIPEILDIKNLIKLLEYIGVKVTKLDKGDYVFQADDIQEEKFDTEEYLKACSRLRGTVLLLGPILSRFGRAVMSKPGGDKIGRRRLDTHFFGFRKLGAQLSYDEENAVFCVRADKLVGTSMLLDEASITGTANIIMAAVMAEGTTQIYNAACEPYIQQLCKLLNNMGAKISGISSNLLTIEGVSSLHGAEHTVLSDMIEVGSFIGMAALAGKGITIKNAQYENLGIIPYSFERLGVKIEKRGNDIFIPEQKCYEIETFIDGGFLHIADAPWPGLTPDLLSVFIVVATQAKGSVLIHQKMFESRLFFVDNLIDMGAQILLCDPHRAVVIGHNRMFPLHGRRMSSPDIRAGIALLLAALTAEGVSIIDNVEQIDRGYESIETRLNALGARITRIQ